MRPAQAISTLALTTLALTALIACAGPMPPPPIVKVTSPQRGMISNSAGQITVTGQAIPGEDGSPIAKVTVNKQVATLASDGSFTATITIPTGATLLETTAYSQEGAKSTDARAVQVGELRPVGSTIEKAVVASLSPEAFAKLAAAAGPAVKNLDFMSMVAAEQPMAQFGDSWMNATPSITAVHFADIQFKLTPTNGGLAFQATVTGLSVGAHVKYGGTLTFGGGSADITATADDVTLTGTLQLTPDGTAAGFSAAIQSPVLAAPTLHLSAKGGLAADIANFVEDHLGGTVNKLLTSSAAKAIGPILNTSLGALAGDRQLDVMGKHLTIGATPAAIAFSDNGANVTLNLKAAIAGSESSPGFIYTPNTQPALDPSAGVEIGLSDDLINELLAEVHAMGVFDIHIDQDVGLFDHLEIKSALPPMITANTDDGSMRLVLGDMIASVSSHGTPLLGAAINAEIDAKVLRGETASQIALDFEKIHLYVNVIGGNATDPGQEVTADDLSDSTSQAIHLQLDNLDKFLVNVPLPEVAGVKLDNLALHADGGYVMVSGQIH